MIYNELILNIQELQLNKLMFGEALENFWCVMNNC